MHKRFRHALTYAVCVFVAVTAVGCGDDDSSPAAPANPISVNGTVAKGPVGQSTVNIYKINSDSSIGQLVAGPFTTDANGDWTGEVPAGTTGPHVLAATGGSYVDEVSQATVQLTDGFFGIIDPSKSTTSHITPVSQSMATAAGAAIEGGLPVATAVNAAMAVLTTAFGFDVSTTMPSIAASATNEQKEYAALLGGVSQLLSNNPALSAFDNSNPFDVVVGFMDDLSDGKFDGIDADGEVVMVYTNAAQTTEAAFPALDATGIEAWLIAANTYAASVPELSGISIPTDIDLDFDGGFPSGSVSGTVTFSNTGASSLPSTSFTPSEGLSAGGQVVWVDAQEVIVSVMPHPTLTGKATTVSVSDGQSAVFYAVDAQSGVPGVTINTTGFAGASSAATYSVTFTNALLTDPELQTPLTVNGNLVFVGSE